MHELSSASVGRGGGENVENLFVEEVVWIRLLFQIEFDGLVFAIGLPSAREGYT